MDKFPVPDRRRIVLENIIRVIDLIAYAAVLVGGCFALFATPASVVGELGGHEWLVFLWAFLLGIGGSAGFVGRLTRFWMVEVPSTVLALAGILIYVIVLGRFAFVSVTAAVAVFLLGLGMLAMARRYIELQIFSTEPGHRDFRTRAALALRRRTQNFVGRLD